jgi:ubiquinone/menaquinone biosynthesis C-methylase UbiE
MANTAMHQKTAPQDFDAIRSRMKATWMAGDFGQIAKLSQPIAEAFIARRSVKPGMRVLDVACGTGNLAIPAAKAGAKVTGVDFAANLLDEAKDRARREGVPAKLDEGDAENLPYEDSSFDLVVSMFGAMFAPRPERVAGELLRVCRPGGQIAMANWTPAGFAGQLFKINAKYNPPPEGLPRPLLWGDAPTVRERFGNRVTNLQMTPVMAELKYPFPVPETVEFYRTYFGPAVKSFEALPEDKQAALRGDMEKVFAHYNQATDGMTTIAAEYLDVSATRV